MDWTILIDTAINLALARCKQQIAPKSTAKEYLRSRYDGKVFDEPLIKDTMTAIHRTIADEKRKLSPAERREVPKHSRSELRQLAIDKLTAAMKAPQAAVDKVMAKAGV